MGWRRQEDPLHEVNVLELQPVRLAEWEEGEGRVTLIRPRPAAGGRGRLRRWLLYQMAARRIRLDEVGSWVWLRLDGERSVAQLAGDLRDAFGAQVEPAEERLGHLVRVLRREGLVRYPGWDA